MAKKQKLTKRKGVRRRGFVKTALATMAFPSVISSAVVGSGGMPAPSERITLAVIGVGHRGRRHVRAFLRKRDAQIVATCDPFKDRRKEEAKRVNDYYAKERGRGSYTGCKAYRDFREVMSRDDVDAVVIATPDHWHVPIAVAAARARKHLFLEKPVGLSIAWDKVCREICQRYDVVFQYGTQQRSMGHCRHGCELVRNGRIGEVHTIKVNCPNGSSGGSPKPIPVPEGFDYDLWLGPAPMTPYTRDRCSGDWPKIGTYFVYDNCLGFLSGWGAHPLDIAVWGCEPGNAVPVEIWGTGDIPKEGLFDTVINWEIEGRYANGVRFEFDAAQGDSTTFVGSEGWVKISRSGNDAEPKSLLGSMIKPDELHLRESHDHPADFLNSIRSQTPTVSPVDVAVQSDFISHLCDIAVRTGERIRWDPEQETILNGGQAQRMMDRILRSPWHL